MAVAIRSGRRTYADLQELPNDRFQYELIAGELYVNPAPNILHQTANANLTLVVGAHVRSKKLGKVLAAPTDVVFDDENTLQPDLLFVSTERLGIIHENNLKGAPDLVVEIVSPSSRLIDRQTKMATYARFGVANYWILDPATHEADAYVLDRGEYQRVASAVGDGPFTAPPFLELTIALAEVWD